jgi:hypothetical protein
MAINGLTGILMLNICLLIPIMTSVANGIDSSNLNGLSPVAFKIGACSELPGLQACKFYLSGKRTLIILKGGD